MRHRWKNEPESENLFDDTYRVEKCVKCGLLKLHEYKGGAYSLEYVIGGKLLQVMPKCIESKVLTE